ncbi:uncharacterized protein J4E88_009920 [Alternaria novae-zelandiae]|uniref:uncharacterized protein n=1 Tax=Alternaria novae-zelandiae TaxID=430562 RepID=UPI0020C50B47|nr:uncharacterized protein J4E88_009920 [Alternaria novae-zelandiae]KAI4669638.1 hypothetical protein J4E88_009920 [Alternaria novae-zelandiae]
MGEQNAQTEKDWLEENRVPKGPKADRQETEEASAVPQQDAHRENQQLIPREPKADGLARNRQAETRPDPEQNAHIKNDRIKENQQSIPTEPKADRLAKVRQADTKLVPEQDARPEDDWIKADQQLIPTEPKADRLARNRQAEARPVPEQDRIKENQHRIPTGPRADRLVNTQQAKTRQDLYRDAARRAYTLLRPIQKHPRREGKDAHPTPTHHRSRSPEEEREFNSSFPPLPSSRAATTCSKGSVFDESYGEDIPQGKRGFNVNSIGFIGG